MRFSLLVMIRKRKIFFEIFFPFLILFLYCEYVQYYLVINQCQWPELQVANEDPSVQKGEEDTLRVLVITDIHLIGSQRGVWLDGVIREWEMYRAFHTALNHLQPELVFVLGDTMDEGLYSTPEAFREHVKKFKKLFAVPEGTSLYTVAGNHDIGFHYEISKQKNDEFVSAFNAPSIRMFTVKGNHFVLVNSMAFEGDACFLCKPAMEELSEIEKILKCSRGRFNGTCDDLLSNATINNYSKPILMQHFPLYRPSDMECNDPDAAPFPLREELFKEAWDCLSKNATLQLLSQIEPRLSISGHTHHGCTKKLPIGDGMEITIPSINWRNKNNPTIGLGVFTPNNYAFTRCPIPQQSTSIILYAMGTTLMMFWLMYRLKRSCRKHYSKYIFV